MDDERGASFYVFGGCLFRIDDAVMVPKQGSELLARALDVREGETVLDIGAGAGLTAVLAAKKARKVIATDIVPEGAACTAANAVINGVAERIEVRTGDLFAPVAGLSFDLVISNPPQMPTPPGRERNDPAARADNGGLDGWEILTHLIADAPRHLNREGRLLFTLFDFLGVKRAFAELERAGLVPRIVRQEEHPFPRIGFERLAHIRSVDREGVLSREEIPTHCLRLVLCGTKP